ncbi:MAG: hypothetical protein IT260_13410 [Saprospiraceae bacterium]|nr:hypothetical protein [Saprospiraceae bacterium]
MDNTAILCLQSKALPMVKKLTHDQGLPAEQAEEILNQSTVVFLRKIEEGADQFQGHAPSTYLIEIAKRVARMATRSQQRGHEPLENARDLHDETWEAELRKKEAAELTRHLLTQLGEPCQQVIRLHYIDGYSDEEAIQQQLTRYSTKDSLKMKRSDCMKKLVQLAQQWKMSTNI